jgi:hypothetical protein
MSLLGAFTVKFHDTFKVQNSVIRIFLLKFTWLGMQNQDGMNYNVQKRVTPSNCPHSTLKK